MKEEKIIKQIEEGYGKTISCIKKNPMQAVIVAFLGGYLIGRINQWVKDLFK